MAGSGTGGRKADSDTPLPARDLPGKSLAWTTRTETVTVVFTDLVGTALEAGSGAAALVAQARKNAREALRLSRRVAVQRGEIYRLQARLHHLLGESGEAARWLVRAIAECESLGARPELARAHLDAADSGVDLGDGRGRAAHLARAAEIFKQIGLLAEAPITSRRAA